MGPYNCTRMGRGDIRWRHQAVWHPSDIFNIGENKENKCIITLKQIHNINILWIILFLTKRIYR